MSTPSWATVRVPWTPRHSHCVVSCRGKLVLLGGLDPSVGFLNDVWASTDGCQWVELPAAAWNARAGHGAAVKEGAIYVIGGTDKTQDPMNFMSDVWRSDDAGNTWSLVSPVPAPDFQHWTGRWQHGVAVHINPGSKSDGYRQCYSNEIYGDYASPTNGDSRQQKISQLVVVGGRGESGYLSDVWGSEDGKQWMALTSSAAFGSRAMLGLVSHRGVLYVMGGFNGTECLNDTWASVEGGRWTCVCNGAAWMPRRSHCVASDGHYMYIVGGTSFDGEVFSDMWRSVDGSRWELLCVEASWHPCYNHAVQFHPTECVGTIPRALVSTTIPAEQIARERVLLYIMGGIGRLSDGKYENHSSYGSRGSGISLDKGDILNVIAASSCMAVNSVVTAALLPHREGRCCSVDQVTDGPRESDGHFYSASVSSGYAGAPLSMQTVTSCVIELYRLRAGLEEVQRGNQQIVSIVEAAASLEKAKKPFIAQHGRDTSCDSRLSEIFSDVQNDQDLMGFEELQREGCNQSEFEGSTSSGRPHRLGSQVGSPLRANNSSTAPVYPEVGFKAGLIDEGLSRFMPRSSSSSSSSTDLFHDAVAPPSPYCNHLHIETSNDLLRRQEFDLPPPPLLLPLPQPPPPPPPLSMPRSAQEHRFIHPATLASFKERLRGERTQLQWHQEQVRRSALDGAMQSDGWATVPTEPARSDAVSEDPTVSQKNSQILDALIAERTAYVATSLADARRDLAELRSFIANPGVWQRRLEYGKQRITEAMRCNFPIQTQLGDTSDNSVRHQGRALPPSSLFPSSSSLEGPTIRERVHGDGGGDDHGTGPAVGRTANGPRTQSLIAFQEAESELRSLLDQPKQPRSLRSTTDDALERLRECLDLRARAARGMVPPAESTDTFDMSAASKALAWAQLWDSNDILGMVKFQVHSAVNMELRRIPVELDRALTLKARLLPASLAYLEVLEAEMAERVTDALRTDLELEQWVHHLVELNDSGSIRTMGCMLADRIAALRERMFVLEDAQIDARSAYEKVFKRKERGSGSRRCSEFLGPITPSARTPSVRTPSARTPFAIDLPSSFMQPTVTVEAVPSPQLPRDLQSGTEWTIDDAMSATLATLARAHKKFRATEIRLKRTIALAARMAHVIFPEITAIVPGLVDPTSHRLRLVDLDQGMSGGSGVRQPSEVKGSRGGADMSAALPWLDLGMYTNVEVLHAPCYSLHGLSGAYMSESEGSGERPGGIRRSVRNEIWLLSAMRDGQKVLLKGYGVQNTVVPFSTWPSKSFPMSKTDERATASSVSSAPVTSPWPGGEQVRDRAPCNDRKFSKHAVDHISRRGHGSPMDCRHGRSDGSYDDSEAREVMNRDCNGELLRGRNGLSKITVISDEGAVLAADRGLSRASRAEMLEDENELEWLMTMPRMQDSIAGVTGLVDAYGGAHDPQTVLGDAINKSSLCAGVGDNAKCVVFSPQTMPLFYLELPFPIPGTSLRDWVLDTTPPLSSKASHVRRTTVTHPVEAPRHARIGEDEAALGSRLNSSSQPPLGLRSREKKNKGSYSGISKGRSPWELQHMARQILAILSAVHSAGKAHGAVSPDAIEVEENSGRVRLRVLPASLILKNSSASGSNPILSYLAPELEDRGMRRAAASPNSAFVRNGNGSSSGSFNEKRKAHTAEVAADIFAFGVLLHWIHLPDASPPIAGNLILPPLLDSNLRALLGRLLEVDALKRPTASDAILHPYFTASFSDRLVASGDLLRQDEKLEAVRALIKQVRDEHRDRKEEITVNRSFQKLGGGASEDAICKDDAPAAVILGHTQLVHDVLGHFSQCGGNSGHGARSRLKVTFAGEAGADEGGLSAEMFHLFFQGLVAPDVGLFETSSIQEPQAIGMGVSSTGGTPLSYLPRSGPLSRKEVEMLRATGRAIVKCWYEGKRIGSCFAPSLFKYLAHGQEFRHAKRLEPRALDDLKRYDPSMGASLEWILTHGGAEDLGLDFDELPGREASVVTDANKGKYVQAKVRHVLMECRLEALDAIRSGFWQAMVDLSPEATPFLRLLSATDWNLLLSGEDDLTAEAVTSVLTFQGYGPTSQVPRWLPSLVEQFSPDNLRRFLIFCTGSPSLPPVGASPVEITVQRQPTSEALPVAHTCFSKLDLPDYLDHGLFQVKLLQAIQECGTFDRV